MNEKGNCELYEATKPCSNCPYRTDAPTKHWHKDEFKKVVASEQDPIGSVFQCHKKNGSVCVGWLMKQDETGLPSIALRLSLSRNKVTREYLDRLSSPAPLYKDVREMIKANYPELLKKCHTNKSKWTRKLVILNAVKKNAISRRLHFGQLSIPISPPTRIAGNAWIGQRLK